MLILTSANRIIIIVVRAAALNSLTTKHRASEMQLEAQVFHSLQFPGRSKQPDAWGISTAAIASKIDLVRVLSVKR